MTVFRPLINGPLTQGCTLENDLAPKTGFLCEIVGNRAPKSYIWLTGAAPRSHHSCYRREQSLQF